MGYAIIAGSWCGGWLLVVLGDELSPVAQSVADALVGGRWPKLEEWAALGAEYETALLLMGAQRPGLNGILDRGPGDHL